MPADRREQVRQLPSGKWQLRYYDPKGVRHSGGAFPSKSAARTHYRKVIEPTLNGRLIARRDLTFSQLVEVFLERHATVATPRTIRTLRERLQRPLATFGTVPLVELEGMTDDVAQFAAGLPDRFRHPVVLAFRQTVEAGVRYGYLATNPVKAAGPNPAPPPRAVRVFTPAELDSLSDELDQGGTSAVRFAAGTGLRPAEWAHLERRDIDRARSIITVRGTKTLRSRREVPLTTTAAAAIDALPARIDSPFVFAAKRGGPFDVENFRKRAWGPAIDAAGIAKPARLYDLRSTFASNALAAGLTVYELARVMGTSVRMIELHYGTLLDTAHDSILQRLDRAGGGG
jgi:integrase